MSLQVLARKEGRICPSRILSPLASPVFTRPQYLPRSRHPLISVCHSVSVFIVSMDSTKSYVQYNTCGIRLKRKFIFLNILYCVLDDFQFNWLVSNLFKLLYSKRHEFDSIPRRYHQTSPEVLVFVYSIIGILYMFQL